MAKKPLARKPHNAPFVDHAVLPEIQQRKFLGVGEQHTLNLGHPSTQDRLTENPAGRVVDYANNEVSKGVVRGPPRSQSVYGKFRDPADGHDFDRWAGYAKAGSFHGKDGKEPTVPDPRGRASNESDGYLRSTQGWARFDAGSESGEGRLEKSRK